MSLSGVVLSVSGNFDRHLMATKVRKQGGRVDNLVHKNVNFVVCDEVAVRRNTQRVRKAVKFKIPIVSEKWLIESLKTGEMLDHRPYLFHNVPGAESSAAEEPGKVKVKGNKFKIGEAARGEDEGESFGKKAKNKFQREQGEDAAEAAAASHQDAESDTQDDGSGEGADEKKMMKKKKKKKDKAGGGGGGGQMGKGQPKRKSKKRRRPPLGWRTGGCRGL